MQVVCSQCQQTMSVEQTGITVACPHCGTHLEIPEGLGGSQQEAGGVSQPTASGQDAPSSDAIPSFGQPVDFTDQSDADVATAEPVGEGPQEAVSVPEQAQPLPQPAFTPPEEPPAAFTPPEQSAGEEASASFAPVAPHSERYKRRRTVSQFWFILVVSYASAVTIACIFLFLKLQSRDAHQLEHLPDIVPPRDRNGEIALKLVPREAEMPPGHVLELGDERHFGHIKLKPLRVTQGPIEFVHYSDPARKKEAVGPVLKLWLQFENVSETQTFRPLGNELVWKRVRPNGTMAFHANNFVCPKDAKDDDKECLLIYDHVVEGEWDLEGQKIDRPLAPGESFTTYIPTEEGDVTKLDGDLIWRVQFRKGYNPQSRRGVTTVVEVVFNSDEIESESPESSVQS